MNDYNLPAGFGVMISVLSSLEAESNSCISRDHTLIYQNV